MKPIGNSKTPDRRNGFTVASYGPNAEYTWAPSKYCRCQNSGSGATNIHSACIWWNTTAPAASGIFSAINVDNEISFKPANNTITSFSFNFVDWNDEVERTHLVVIASDGTSTIVTEPANKQPVPLQKFEAILVPADIAAGLYIEKVRWIGKYESGEVIGFYNFQTYTNPIITNNSLTANPDHHTLTGNSLDLNPLNNDVNSDSDSLQITSINSILNNNGTSQRLQVPGGTIDVSTSGAIIFTVTAELSDTSIFTY